MLSPVQIYVEAIIAVALTVTLGIITVFVATGVTATREISVVAGLLAMIVSGAVLAFRLWRMTRGAHSFLNRARHPRGSKQQKSNILAMRNC